jgi:hypothetical protein
MNDENTKDAVRLRKAPSPPHPPCSACATRPPLPGVPTRDCLTTSYVQSHHHSLLVSQLTTGSSLGFSNSGLGEAQLVGAANCASTERLIERQERWMNERTVFGDEWLC